MLLIHQNFRLKPDRKNGDLPTRLSLYRAFSSYNKCFVAPADEAKFVEDISPQSSLILSFCRNMSLQRVYRVYSVQGNDEFKIMRTTKNFDDDTLLLSFTKNNTVCKSNPQSCGHILGEYSNTSTYYKFVFEFSGGSRASYENPIWIDTTIVRQFTGTYSKQMATLS